MIQPNLALVAATAEDNACAVDLAQRLGLPLLVTASKPAFTEEVDAVLIVRGKSLHLQQTGKGAPGPVMVDFGSAGMRHRRGAGANELLGRAVGWGKKSPLKILDATAGLGRDAFVLADLGCDVTLCEREPIIVELLRAGLRVAEHSGDPWLATVSHRMRLCPGDVRHLPVTEHQGVDVIYLDPMFPQRTKSAAVKKDMALFQRLLSRSTDPQQAETLLRWSLQQDVARVVVKRPAKASSVAALPPSHCIRGKSVRYDVYVRRKLF